MRWLCSETIAMTGSPAVRCSMDSTTRSLRRSVAPTGPVAEIRDARPATARCAGRSLVGLRFGFTKRDLIRVPSDQGYASLHPEDSYRQQFELANSALPECSWIGRSVHPR